MSYRGSLHGPPHPAAAAFTGFMHPQHTSDFVTFLPLSKVQCFKWKDSSKGMTQGGHLTIG